MKGVLFSEEQIIAMLKEHNAGAKTTDLAREHIGSEATFHNWKVKYGGMGISVAKRLKALEVKNAKLKKLLAAQMLDATPLRAFVENTLGPVAKREGARLFRHSWACRSGGPVRSSAQMARWSAIGPAGHPTRSYVLGCTIRRTSGGGSATVGRSS